MNSEQSYLIPNEFSFDKGLPSCGLLILGAGFEDRDRHFISNTTLNKDTSVIIIDFKSQLEENKSAKNAFRAIIDSFELQIDPLHVDLDTSAAHLFDASFCKQLINIPLFTGDIYIDISGMPSHAICTVLANVRELFPTKVISIIYTSAQAYHPSHNEYLDLIRENSSDTDEIEYVPRTMALEMADNLIPLRFTGHRSAHCTTTLLLFAGYEVHRSSGVIEAINPSKLVLIYGVPGEEKIGWRTELSRKLHKKFESSRTCAVETTSTLHVKGSLELLEDYYEHMFDDHDFAISPVCSKMQNVAVYLFWERYREVQLVFPLPIGYNPKKAPIGIGSTYITHLPPRSALHKGTR